MNLDWRPAVQEDALITPRPVTFEPGKSRKIGFVVLAVFALIWNGIISIIAFGPVTSLLRGDSDWELVPLLFLSPFLLIGLVLIGACLRSLMLIFAPSIAVELDTDTLPLGGTTTLRWHILGRRERVERITITLVGQEHATYRRGTDTTTDKKDFYEQTIVGDDPAIAEMAPMSPPDEHGQALLSIPMDTMHSFNASNNKIVWKLIVRAKVSRWPDPKDEYEITVLPMPTQHFT